MGLCVTSLLAFAFYNSNALTRLQTLKQNWVIGRAVEKNRGTIELLYNCELTLPQTLSKFI